MKLIGLVVAFVVSSTGISSAQSMFRGDPSHSGIYSGTAPRQFHRVKWKFATGDRVVSSPVIDGKTIYFGSDDANIYAVDAETGRQIWKWKFSTEGERRFEAKGLHGMQPKNQTIADPFDIFLSSPVVVKGAVYFGSGDGNI